MNANKQATKWVRLGDYIERSMVNNNDLRYGPEFIYGVNSNGEFCESKANTYGINLKPYKIVHDGDFVYNPSRLNIGSIALRKGPLCIVSHLYVVFRLNAKGKEVIKNEYLELYFKRKEFQRMITYLNFGSQRPEFNFFEMSEIQIPLPTPEIQQELVDTSNGLKSLAEENEALIEPLSKACEAFIIDCTKKGKNIELGEYIVPCEEKNSNEQFTLKDVRGISIQKKLIPTKADMTNVSLKPYKLLKPEEFCYVTVTSRNGGKISLAMNDTNDTYIVSSSYVNFKSKDKTKLLPEYLYLFLSRSEFDRYSRFNSWGSARETFNWEDLCRINIPIVDIDIQQSIVNLYRCLEESKTIAREARMKLENLCPALIQKAIHS